MAADTREDTTKKSSTPSTSSSKENKPEAHAASATPSNANAIVLATGKDVGVVDVLKTIKLSEFKEVHKKPCVRDSLLTGIGGGFGIGGIRAIWGATVWSSCNWAVGSFIFGSFLMYEFCQRRRLLEQKGMKRAVEVIERKKAEKQQKVEEKVAEAKATRARAKEQS